MFGSHGRYGVGVDFFLFLTAGASEATAWLAGRFGLPQQAFGLQWPFSFETELFFLSGMMLYPTLVNVGANQADLEFGPLLRPKMASIKYALHQLLTA